MSWLEQGFFLSSFGFVVKMVAKRNVSVRSGFGSFLSSPIASSTLIIVGICVLQAVYSIYSSKDRTVRLVEGLLEEGEVAREQMEAMTEMDSSKLEANSTENLSRGADVNRNDTTQGTLQKFFSQEENGREAPTQVKCEDPATERLCAAVRYPKNELERASANQYLKTVQTNVRLRRHCGIFGLFFFRFSVWRKSTKPLRSWTQAV